MTYEHLRIFFFDGEDSPLLALREYIQFIKTMLFNLHSKNLKILFEILKHIIIWQWSNLSVMKDAVGFFKF